VLENGLTEGKKPDGMRRPGAEVAIIEAARTLTGEVKIRTVVS